MRTVGYIPEEDKIKSDENGTEKTNEEEKTKPDKKEKPKNKEK